MRDLFATLPEDPAPPLPAGYLDGVLAKGRRSARRARLAGAAAWAVVAVMLAALVVPAVPFDTSPAGRPGRPGIPDHFAGYSPLTSSVSRSPAGRAIALYGYGNGEMFPMVQSLVVGADHDTYRQVDAMEERGDPSALLAPDGTSVLLGDDRGATGDLLLVNLTTGERRSVPLGATVGVRLLAWSPDGRYVAYSAAPVTGSDGSIDYVETTVGQTGTLRLLDLSTGRSTEVPALKPAWMAAFAPDGRRLAVQVGQTAHLIDLAGRETATVPLPKGRELAAGVGWTPDGAFLATVPWAASGPFDGTVGGNTAHGTFLSLAGTVDFVAVDRNAAPPAPVLDVVQLLGWRSAGSMLVLATNDRGQLSFAEVALGSGARRTLSRFDTGSTCELGMQTCQVWDLHLATGLLPDLVVREAGSPQRGPWPLALTVPITGVVIVVVLVWRRRRRTRVFVGGWV
jgi:dipeptidyl aminopeptidase/acylaminoacyl peptidase